MATQTLSVVTSTQQADTESSQNTVVMRDNNGDTKVRDIHATRGRLSAVFLAVSSKTTAYAATDSDGIILVNATGGAVTITLPLAATSTNQIITVKKTDASGNAVTVDGNGSETVDGAANVSLAAQYNSVTLVCSGTAWFKIAGV